MIRLIIFDLDGPILDSLKRSKMGVLNGVKKLIEEKGAPPEKINLTKETFIKYWGYPGLITAKLMFPILTNNELGVIVDCWRKNELKKKLPLVKGALKTLKFLKKKGYFTALLTSRSHNLKFHLENYNLDKLFDIVQSWTPLAHRPNPQVNCEKIHQNHIFNSCHKPNPDVFNQILRWATKKGISKKEMVMIDDTLVGLEAARNCNILLLGVCTGPLNSKAKWQKYGNLDGKYVIESIAELPAWLKKNK